MGYLHSAAKAVLPTAMAVLAELVAEAVTVKPTLLTKEVTEAMVLMVAAAVEDISAPAQAFTVVTAVTAVLMAVAAVAVIPLLAAVLAVLAVNSAVMAVMQISQKPPRKMVNLEHKDRFQYF